jgi:hypothetical protein
VTEGSGETGTGSTSSFDEQSLLDMFSTTKSQEGSTTDPVQEGGQGNNIEVGPFYDQKAKLTLGSYSSEVINQAKEVISFMCPGDSVISGFNSTFDPGSFDRLFQPQCLFFQDSNGGAVRRTACTDIKENGGLASDKSFSCPENKVLAGFTSSFDAGKMDRTFVFQCCSLESKNKVPVVYQEDACSNRVPRILESRLSSYWLHHPEVRDDSYGPFSVNDQVNAWKEPAIFDCQVAVKVDSSKTDDSAFTWISWAVIRSISSTYSGTHHDRRWSFQCCSLTPRKK